MEDSARSLGLPQMEDAHLPVATTEYRGGTLCEGLPSGGVLLGVTECPGIHCSGSETPYENTKPLDHALKGRERTGM